MNEYEGLNLPQLLELMHGLVMPDPISSMPEGPGWWVVAAWLVAVLAILVRAFIVHRRRNRYRREAAAMLDAIGAVAEANPAKAAADIGVVLKHTALQAYPRAEVASLHGQAWARFLAETAGHDQDITKTSIQLASAAYRGDGDGRTLLEPARRWVRIHRA